MNYTVDNAIEVLTRTPAVLRTLLGGLPAEWLDAREGPDGWSPREIVCHLIHGEKVDWIPRAEIILGGAADKRFRDFDPDAMPDRGGGKTLAAFLEEFAALRAENVGRLKALGLDEAKLSMTGVHPEFGEVTLRQHLSTWVAHDLSHISQVARVLAKQYRGEVGPWVKYLRILQ